MLAEVQHLLLTALPYLLPLLVVGVGIRCWWEWRRST